MHTRTGWGRNSLGFIMRGRWEGVEGGYRGNGECWGWVVEREGEGTICFGGGSGGLNWMMCYCWTFFQSRGSVNRFSIYFLGFANRLTFLFVSISILWLIIYPLNPIVSYFRFQNFCGDWLKYMYIGEKLYPNVMHNHDMSVSVSWTRKVKLPGKFL